MYSQSPKNQREIENCAILLDQEIKKFGRVLEIRWVASFLKTFSAVWQNCTSLCKNFKLASTDSKRNKTVQCTLQSLLKYIYNEAIFIKFMLNYLKFHFKLIRRSIRILKSIKEGQICKKLLEIKIAVEKVNFSSNTLIDNKKKSNSQRTIYNRYCV